MVLKTENVVLFDLGCPAALGHARRTTDNNIDSNQKLVKFSCGTVMVN
jgi:hypothetical protein